MVLPTKKKSNPTHVTVNNKDLSSDYDIANAFNKHFITIGSDIKKGLYASPIEKDKPTINPPAIFYLPEVDEEFVYTEISKMSINKAFGFDEISPNMLKLANLIIVPSLTYIINLSLHSGIFPDDWKYAKVIPLHKNGDTHNVNNWAIPR
ncbi:uncharacterized protein LOC117101027 [Anneissia japonica]|uniref:uncharacterized protein LOC117101027 n=1 Tax=Anneissia japonica TaxID=1529436 RepID=UPI001425B4EE|nr:uncharacterized protein LOC117101027 [Anneissia japonica]